MKTAMILAAGRGERLKPVTDTLPKSLCRVKGKPLIEHHIINLAKAGYTKIVINHAWLGDQIRHYLGDGSKWQVKIHYSPEPPGGLETGGGIVNALPLLGNHPFLVVNADIYTDFDFATLSAPRLSFGHLILTGNTLHGGDFGLDENACLTNDNRQFTFLGIAAYEAHAFHELPYGRYSIVNSLLRKLADTRQLTGAIYNGLWIDAGSADRLQYANQML